MELVGAQDSLAYHRNGSASFILSAQHRFIKRICRRHTNDPTLLRDKLVHISRFQLALGKERNVRR